MTCPACLRRHEMCRALRDVLWSLVKDRHLKGRPVQGWARAYLFGEDA